MPATGYLYLAGNTSEVTEDKGVALKGLVLNELCDSAGKKESSLVIKCNIVFLNLF